MVFHQGCIIIWPLRIGVLSETSSPFASSLGATPKNWSNGCYRDDVDYGDSSSKSWQLQRICEEEARSSQWQPAILLLDSLRCRGLKNLPRGVYSSWFLGACGRAGNWAFSLDIFNKIKSPRRQAILNQVAYECQRGRSWLQAISLLNEIRSRYVRSIVTAFEKLGHDQMAMFSSSGSKRYM